MIFEAVPYGAALLFIHGAAYCPELPGINSYGATQEEASENFKEAAELFFEPSEYCINT